MSIALDARTIDGGVVRCKTVATHKSIRPANRTVAFRAKEAEGNSQKDDILVLTPC